MSDGPVFDIRAWATKHGYVLRDLHDGQPVPQPGKQATPSAPPPPRREEFLAIVGRHGYVHYDHGTTVGWYYIGRDGRERLNAERKLKKLGATVLQSATNEAAGLAPLPAIKGVLRFLGALRIKPARSPVK